MSLDKEITNIAKKMDYALDNNDSEQIKKLIELLISLENKTVDITSLFKIYYNLGTAYADLIFISRKNYIDKEEYVRKSILYYRKGEDLIKEHILSVNDGTVQLLTNLGNTYNCMNRFTEAIEVFNKAIDIAPSFSIANGNLGECLLRYSTFSYNSYNAYRFHLESMKYFSKALEYPQYIDSQRALEDFTSKYFPMKEHYNSIKIKLPKTLPIKYKTKAEQKYRKWCLENRLVLNELNDIDNSFLASEDILHIPSITQNISGGRYSKFHSSFNELKQEFVSNRFLLYEAFNNCDKNHFSDNYTYILETFDNSIYTLNTSKLKTVFKNVYSLFDKIAFFINEYFVLNIGYRDVSFKNIWKNRTLLEKMKMNTGLYTLYWIYIDLFANYNLSTDPKIQKINKIRNSIEHRCFKIVDENEYIDILTQNDENNFEFKISYLELKNITLYLFKILRTSMLNIVSSVIINENQNDEIDKLKVPINLHTKDKRDNLIIFK